MDFDDELGFLIADPDNPDKFTDMRERTRVELDWIGYRLAEKHDRARLHTVKSAYRWAMDRLEEFLEKGADTPIDPVTRHALEGRKSSLARFIEKEELDQDTLKFLARERAKRKCRFRGCKIPGNWTITKFYKLVSLDRLQEAINAFARFYRIAPARVVVHKRKDHPDYHGEYKRRSKTIHLYRSGLGKTHECVSHLCHEFFHHLASEKSWYFHDNPRIHKDYEEIEANRFRSDMMKGLRQALGRSV